jgi:hypothetical protein
MRAGLRGAQACVLLNLLPWLTSLIPPVRQSYSHSECIRAQGNRPLSPLDQELVLQLFDLWLIHMCLEICTLKKHVAHLWRWNPLITVQRIL